MGWKLAAEAAATIFGKGVGGNGAIFREIITNKADGCCAKCQKRFIPASTNIRVRRQCLGLVGVSRPPSIHPLHGFHLLFLLYGLIGWLQHFCTEKEENGGNYFCWWHKNNKNPLCCQMARDSFLCVWNCICPNWTDWGRESANFENRNWSVGSGAKICTACAIRHCC